MKTVFFDVDTQLDFVSPAGALSVPGAGHLVPSWKALTNFALSAGKTIISSVDAHSEEDPEFAIWKPHCVAGTIGQQKVAGTLTSKHLVLGSQSGALDELRGRLDDAAQVIVQKQMLDPFSNVNLSPLLHLMQADRFIVYGVVAEICVQVAALGLLRTGAEIQIAADGIRGFGPQEEQAMLQRFRSEGGTLTSVKSVIEDGNS